MSTYHLQSVFRPQSVAVIGGSPRERSAGRAVMRNLRGTGFPGKVAWINPRHAEIDGIRTVKRLKDLDWVPELVVITAPAAIVPQVVRTAAERGVQSAIILTAHLGEGPGSLSAQVEAVARKHGLRILGPHCLGVIAPHARLNASIAAHFPQAGDLALISESSAIAAALVEWGVARSVGFSAVVSLGDTMDVDFGDLLDYFATDYRTRAILLYVEQIKDARKFMSAARAAARAKPVVVVKSGRAERVQPGSRDTHVQALARADDVYGAAFNRAGLLRVSALDELFTAAESLGRLGTFPGRRLAILSNGGGVGRLAVDQLIALRGTLANLSDSTVEKLDAVLPQGWSRSNPVDIVVDADGERYAAAIEALLADNENDAVMVVNVPTAFTSSADAAQALTRTLGLRPRHHRDKPVFAVWLGNDDQATATLNAARVPTYPTEAEAVRGFQHLVRYREAQNALMETPPSLPQDFSVDAAAARALVDAALANGQQWLDPLATHELLKAYGIPSAPVMHARDAHEAMDLAQPLLERGATVALKILSPDIPHKSEVDGVRLNLATLPAVQSAAHAILSRARQLRPDARIDGLLVQPTIVRPKAREIIVGIADDATFGPVIVVGRGGTAVEVINDKALALPPLDLRLAHELIGQTRASRILKAYGDVPAADERALALALVKLAQLAADIPEVRTLDINPLLVDSKGILALDARVAVAPSRILHKGRGHPRFSVFPYPKEWERTIELSDGGRAFVRPVRPEDDALFRAFFARVSDEDLRLRFFQSVKHFSHEFIARLTQLDYARSIALVAIEPRSGEMLGAVRLHADADYHRGEYGILIRSDLKGHGIGWRLMAIMIEYAKWLGLDVVEGQVLRENSTMLAMCQSLGFKTRLDPDDPTVMMVTLPVQQVEVPAPPPAA
ncbi:bifunctional acetate--CoA ligase family protein/GNAT family N-acetyltransferase [Stenotrophomonas maltophilia]|uniref:bifunctional acetate--CoA ligase family protein/GNAT family N-acetyltransferase n=1 Tax=Stenotrophomonas maltophilia TaxID=40324 RepID=UPI000C259116|nr:bifunctional acetate--CoA ligase family protein/GNAT family N-acetyltransferase [Stenotrophomonas maltophilia]MBN5144438.1 bifunctional acetate--CoA ligase family protein/GNAT family N-acetyltransferase [Stenotrophomonas maltophilia]PJK98160.1 GNAT family N-acetyltransferase [Stenotrophomonas maltophilia]BBO53588.1 GCN5 family N-acetyltransferase [Stenotrophomonas maltophilia]